MATCHTEMFDHYSNCIPRCHTTGPKMNPLNLRKQLHDNNSDMREYFNDIKQWGAEMKQKEEANKSKSASKPKDDKKQTVDKNKLEEDKKTSKQSKKAKVAKDYKFWDTFDVDAECEKVDSHEKDDDSESDLTDEIDEDLMELATAEKEKGNKFVKAGRYEDAIKCYTNAIDSYSYDPVFYANRALCHIKLKHFKSAEADCTTALQIDKKYVKAFHRRATARNALGQLQDAKNDLEKLLDLDPTNKESQKLLDEIMKKLGETQTTDVATTQRPISKFTLSRQKQKDQSNLPPQVGNIKATEAIKEKVVERKLPTELAKPSTSKAPISTQSTKTSTNKIKPIISWPAGNDIAVVDSINKSPNIRSKTRLKRIQIFDVDMKSEKSVIEKLESKPVVAKPVEVKKDEPKKNVNFENKTPERIEMNNFENLDHSVDTSNEDFTKLRLAPPTTYVQFNSNWQQLKDDEMKFLYLRQICPTSYKSLFKQCLGTQIFSDIIHVLANGFVQRNVHVFEYLYGLSKVQRFSTLVMFKSGADKLGLLKLIDFMRTDSRHTKEEVDFLIKKYEM